MNRSDAINKNLHEKLHLSGFQQPRTHLMLGNYGNFNIGDEMLLRAIIKDVQKRYGENILFQIPTRNPGFVNVYHKADSHLIEPLPIRAASKILRAFGNSKVI